MSSMACNIFFWSPAPFKWRGWVKSHHPALKFPGSALCEHFEGHPWCVSAFEVLKTDLEGCHHGVRGWFLLQVSNGASMHASTPDCIPIFVILRVGTFFILVITFFTIVTCTIGWHLYPVIYSEGDVFWDAIHHLFMLEHVVVAISKAHSKSCLCFGSELHVSFFLRCQIAVPEQNQSITGGLVSPLSMGYENIPCYVNRFIGPQHSLVHHRL